MVKFGLHTTGMSLQNQPDFMTALTHTNRKNESLWPFNILENFQYCSNHFYNHSKPQIQKKRCTRMKKTPIKMKEET